MPNIQIEVTDTDIADGQPGSSRDPIALAIGRALPLDIRCFVSTARTIFMRGPDVLASIPTPPEASLFISNYDRGYVVRPISFYMDVPEVRRSRKPRKGDMA